MSLFSKQPKHEHQWKLIGAQFHPRPDELIEATGMNPEIMRETLYGFTLLTQQCTECGWIATSRTAGKPDLKKLGFNWPTEMAQR